MLFVLWWPVKTYARTADPSQIIEDSSLKPAKREAPAAEAKAKPSASPTKVSAQSKPEAESLEAKTKTVLDLIKPVAVESPAVKPQLEAAKKTESLKDVQAGLKSLVQISEPGRKASNQSTQISVTKEGVPVYNLESKRSPASTKTVKAIPKIDVGVEPKLQTSNFVLPEVELKVRDVKPMEPLISPALISKSEIQRMVRKKAPETVVVKNVNELRKGIDQVVTKAAIDRIEWKLGDEITTPVKVVEVISADELKLLTAMVLFEKGNQCHVVLGLFDNLAQIKNLRHQAQFYAGHCAHKMGLYSESVSRLTEVIKKEDNEYSQDAVQVLAARDFPRGYHEAIGRLLYGLQNKKTVPDSDQSRASYLIAKYLFGSGKYEAAKLAADSVKKTSPDYDSARYLSAISLFMLGKVGESAQALEALFVDVEKNPGDGKLLALIATNLARLEYKQGKYKKALELYGKVGKDQPLWINALVEQGWAQLQVGDEAGAIGNMYSLHSPYFNTVYKPESFVVRSIGYLDICQYGDAYKTLNWMEKDYRPWAQSLSQYLTNHTSEGAVYKTVKTYLQSGKSTADVDGLPFQIVREAARSKEFLNHQTALNDKEDELIRYQVINEKISADKARAKGRMDQAQRRYDGLVLNLKKAEKDKNLAQNVNLWKGHARLERDLITGYKYLLSIMDQGREGTARVKASADGRIAQEKNKIRAAADLALRERLVAVQKDVAKILDSNELLRYEIFAGSGENIRYQAAGGKVDNKSNRVPASVKPEKMLNWNFDGEYWQDEIGNYRSSLKNNCPESRAR